jgi:hypothetical protein
VLGAVLRFEVVAIGDNVNLSGAAVQVEIWGVSLQAIFSGTGLGLEISLNSLKLRIYHYPNLAFAMYVPFGFLSSYTTYPFLALLSSLGLK